MLIHRLEFRAFMAYPHHEKIDFERLNDAGIFLLNGPTGAGKTTVLDAICYAIYGTVSSQRAESELRSIFADRDVAPFVELELTVQGRRLRIHRTPAWMRPKKRGTGLTQEKATHHVSRLRPGADPLEAASWEEVGNRHRESAEYVQTLIGLTREQFLKVMLLPQGDFSKFLRTVGRERQELLKKLFPIETYERIVERLNELARQAHDRAHDAAQALDTLRDEGVNSLARLKQQLPPLDEEPAAAPEEEAVRTVTDGHKPHEQGQEPPAIDPLQLPAAEFTDWVRHQMKLTLRGGEAEDTRRASIEQRIAAQREKLHELTALSRDWAEYESLTADKERLEEQKQDRHADKTTLETARAAEPVHSAITRAEADQAANEQELTGAVEKHRAAHEIAETQLGILKPGPGGKEPLEARAYRLTAAATQPHNVEYEELATLISSCLSELKGYRKDDQALTAARAEQRSAEETYTTACTAVTTLTEETHQAVTAKEKAGQDLDAFAGVEESLARAQTAAVAARETLEQAQRHAQRLAEASAEVQRTETLYAAAHAAANTARQRVTELSSARMSQAALSLAKNLQQGQECMVCGSRQHPNPATGAPNETLIEQTDIDAACEASDTANAAESAAHSAHTKARTVLEQLTETNAVTPQAAATRLSEAEHALTSAEQAHTAKQAAQQKLKALEQQLEVLAKKNTEAARTQAAARAQAEAAQERVTALEASLEPVRAQVDFTQRIEALERYFSAVRAAETAVTRAEEAAKRAAQSTAGAQAALEDSPFDTVETVRAAVLSGTEQKAIQERLTEYERQLTRVFSALEREAMRDIARRAAAGQSVPEAAEREKVSECISGLEKTRDELLARHTLRESGEEHLKEFIVRFEKQHARSAQAIARHELYGSLAAVASASSANNTRRIDLVNYVLAGEFQAVVRAASAHLKQMSGGRFTLVHSEDKEAKERTSLGLGVRVFDTWQGTDRRTASLSGGETFMASLALALGLAEIVQENNGGVEIDTLFIDEGFGTLDGETLEQVMSTIDGLRENGRTIGLISHVEEMKNRIQAQVVVSKGQGGSTLRVDF